MHAVLWSILCVVQLFLRSAADHYTCDWQGPGLLSPESYGTYQLFCRAPKIEINSTHAQYICPSPIVLYALAADYGFLAPGKLEFSTPCGGGGYGTNFDCGYHTWALCDAPAGKDNDPSTFNCRYMGRMDDCEWPITYANSANAPKSVDIWRKKEGGP